MYEFKSRVRYSEVDEDGRLKLEALLDYFQDCSTFHGEDSGVGMQVLTERGLVWILSSWQILIERYPQLGEPVIIATAPHGFKGFFGYRNYLLKTQEGERLACANAIWTLMDINKGCPARVDQKMAEAYMLEEPLQMAYAHRKIALLEGMRENKEKIRIRRSHLDMNHHVNNGQYVRMAMEYLPMRSGVVQMRAEYRKETVLGEVLCPVCIFREQSLLQVVFSDEQDVVRCVVEFSLQ